VAVRIVRTAIESSATLAALLDDLSLVLRALYADLLKDWTRAFALGISRARKERTEASPLDDHRRLTLVALLVCGLRLRRLVAVGLRRLAFGITGARIELAEPPPPEHHRLTAVLALLL